MRVRSDLTSQPVRIGDNGFHFFERILRSVRVVTFGKHTAGGANLDHVGAVLDDFAHFVLHSLNAVGNPAPLKMKCGR